MPLSFPKTANPAEIWWGGPPGPRGTPSSRCSPTAPTACKVREADGGVGRGPGGPPHELCRLSAMGKTKWHWALCLENSPRMNLDCGGMWDLRQVRSWCQGSQRAQTSKVVSNSGLFGPFFVVGRAHFLIRLTGRQNLIDHNQEVVPQRHQCPLLPA